MNNPFASNRNIFNNIAKPPPKTQLADNPNTGTGTGNTSNTMGKVYQPANNNSNANTGMGGQRVDLNFRGQFRGSATGSVGGSVGGVGQDVRKMGSNTSYDNNPNPNPNPLTTKVISDRQYPPYNPQSSAAMSTYSIPISASNANTSNKFGSQNYQSIQQSQPQPQGSKFGQGQGQGQESLSGVQRQKITFGVGSTSNQGSKIEYDRGKFVNREEFNIGSASLNSQNIYTSNYGSNPNYTPQISQAIQIHPQPQPPSSSYAYSSHAPPPSQPSTRKIQLQMSPIQEHSKHKIDDIEMLDIDAMGDDIEKILASSKNQEELCRLLGIDNVGKREGSGGGGMYRANSMGMQQQEMSRGVMKKGSMPEPSPNKYSQYEANYEDYQQKDQQVFNYEIDNPTQPQYGASGRLAPSQAGFRNNSMASNANSNVNVNASTGGKGDGSLGSQLQMAIQREMKKLAVRGKVRVFLSATDKIEAVKYNMEYI